ncbi:uncharacterized protein A1O9_00212 [Exophiala aquamarina CBS 119918]|uniref:Uncharacterized protein n=1 Tax=Exophiala aquamarina CBS 119918 TaxID=1182545 RepID=A0A072Q2W6_9EURO|nr:uncharacterized protein A1O9_00212 [Exophiala aquamarina CBS 119918]KEF62240.1 hypothetical protein A1O9_00212 [Exophiala aquamarina CBS 119918]
MRKPCIPDLIYHKTFPRPKQGEPASFYAHIQRHIVGEVRVEVQMYYGALDTLEAQYPGLDYTYPPHRRRMSRYPWHRRLFRVFDELSLTNDEILNLCQWEGTRAAKERYEREAQTEVKTTTAHDVVAAPRGSGPRMIIEGWPASSSTSRSTNSQPVAQIEANPDSDELSKTEQDVDGLDCPPAPSNEILDLLRTAIQSRSSLESSVATTQAWEQWLKDALERHEMDIDSVMTALQSIDPEPAQGLDDPDALLSLLNTSPTPDLSPSPPALSPPDHRTYDELHTMVDQLQTDNTRLAADNAALALFLRRTQTEAAR